MPRNNRRNAKIRAIRKRQQALAKSVKKQAKDKTRSSADNSDSKTWSPKDELPTTSKQAARDLEYQNGSNETSEETATPSLAGFWKKPVKQPEKTSVALRRKQRKPVKRALINVDFLLSPMNSDVDEDENEMSNLVAPMRYVDVARAAMSSKINTGQVPKVQEQRSLNMGLEEFPLLQPKKNQPFETYGQSSGDNFELSSMLESESCTDETDTSDVTENYAVENIEQEFAKLEISPQVSNSGAISSKNPCVVESTSGICCEVDSASTTGSYWTEASNENESDNETISYDDDGGGGGGSGGGGGDAPNYQYKHSNDRQPPEWLSSSTFSPEWVEATVKYLAIPLNISIPSFNFLEPDLDFPRTERQFDDANYLRLEERATIALRQAQSKDFSNGGKFM